MRKSGYLKPQLNFNKPNFETWPSGSTVTYYEPFTRQSSLTKKDRDLSFAAFNDLNQP